MPIKYDGKFLIKPGTQKEYTAHMVQEMLQCSQDVKYFAKNYYTIVHPTKGEMIIKLFDFQERMLNAFQQNRFNIVLSSRQIGKALDVNTDILTPTGFKKLDDIKKGDFIYGPTGHQTKVTFITETMNNREVYNVTFDTGEVIKADAEHLWNINIEGLNAVKTVTTLELLQLKEDNKNLLKTRSFYINKANAVEFEKKETPIHPYVFGLWLGNGSVTDGKITCRSDDYGFYKEKLKLLGINTSHFIIDPKNELFGSFSVPGLLNYLKLLDKKQGKYIPNDYIFNNIENRTMLVNGLMDSAGYYNESDLCELTRLSENTTNSVGVILSTLGIKNKKVLKLEKRKSIYDLTFRAIQEVFTLPRKLSKIKTIKSHLKDSRIYVDSIEKTKSVPVKCLQVDNREHLFLCGQTLIPTHNTTCSCIYLLWLSIFHKDKTIAILANKQRTAVSIIDDIKKAYEMLPVWLKPGLEEYNNLNISFDNGTKIFASATTEDALRGETVSLLFCDEFAFVPQNIADKFWKSNFPTLSNGGSAILVSTPNGAAGIFYEIYKEAEGNSSPFKPFKVNWWEFPGRDEKWKDEMIASIGKVGFAQEYGCILRENYINICYNGKKYRVKIGDLYEQGINLLPTLTDTDEIHE